MCAVLPELCQHGAGQTYHFGSEGLGEGGSAAGRGGFSAARSSTRFSGSSRQAVKAVVGISRWLQWTSGIRPVQYSPGWGSSLTSQHGMGTEAQGADWEWCPNVGGAMSWACPCMTHCSVRLANDGVCEMHCVACGSPVRPTAACTRAVPAHLHPSKPVPAPIFEPFGNQALVSLAPGQLGTYGQCTALLAQAICDLPPHQVLHIQIVEVVVVAEMYIGQSMEDRFDGQTSAQQ